MSTSANQKAGAGIAILCAIGSVIALLLGYVGSASAVGVAIVGIVIGTGVARGSFSSTPNATKNG
jgi:hypothetical protein